MKRSPIVDPEPEEPSGLSIDASKITANSISGHRITVESTDESITNAIKYINKNYSPNPPARGLWQRIKGYWEKDDS